MVKVLEPFIKLVQLHLSFSEVLCDAFDEKAQTEWFFGLKVKSENLTIEQSAEVSSKRAI